jgi:hypothetical protein
MIARGRFDSVCEAVQQTIKSYHNVRALKVDVRETVFMKKS